MLPIVTSGVRMTAGQVTANEPREAAVGQGQRPGPGTTGRRRRRRRWLLVGIGVLAVAYLGRGTLLHAVARGLVVQDPIRQADVALMLGGDRCFEQAAWLFHEQAVDRILLVESMPGRLVRLGILPSNEEIAIRELTQRGVPRDAIEIVQGRAAGGWEAARHVCGWMQQNSQPTVVALCPRFVSRETRLVYTEVLGVELATRVTWHPLRDRRYDESNWWHRKEGVLDVFDSYVSLVYVWVNGEQPSTWREWDAEQWLNEALNAEQ